MGASDFLSVALEQEIRKTLRMGAEKTVKDMVAYCNQEHINSPQREGLIEDAMVMYFQQAVTGDSLKVLETLNVDIDVMSIIKEIGDEVLKQAYNS